MNILHVYGALFNKKPFFHTMYRRRAKGEEDAAKPEVPCVRWQNPENC
ncbi:MAG: hypothetical protein K6E22_11920 [Treponema sp.]|nr:hypothetical protein [Treponema sp.]